jgi:hypothetical protein
METIVVHGPRACGKTRNKLAIAAKYGFDARAVIDDPMPRERIPADNVLVLTERPIEGFHNVPFAVAITGIAPV